jgi:ribonuclease P protein component
LKNLDFEIEIKKIKSNDAFSNFALMKNTYPKHEKLKSKTTIDLLFSEGKSVSKYPLRLVFAPITSVKEEHFGKLSVTMKFGVSISKKYFKKAVDRNYFKRVLRETYRLNKQLLFENIDKPYAIMFFYQTKEKLSYQEINEKTVRLFEKFVEVVNKDFSGLK